MFSFDISLWTSDRHAILDNNGKCINHGKDIVIGNHVWIGHGAKLMKGATINDGSVIGGNSLVTKKFFEKNVIIAGNPAKIIKKEISWTRERPNKFI